MTPYSQIGRKKYHEETLPEPKEKRLTRKHQKQDPRRKSSRTQFPSPDNGLTDRGKGKGFTWGGET